MLTSGLKVLKYQQVTLVKFTSWKGLITIIIKFSLFRYNHFLPNSHSEGIRVSQDGDMVSMFNLLSKVLGNSSTPQDSRFVICSIPGKMGSCFYLKYCM